MSNQEPTTDSPVEPQLVSGSAMTTPDTAELITPTEKRTEEAASQPGKAKSGREADKPKSKMPPPPLPINVVKPTPMSRLPSLQQISSHLHISSSPTNPPTATPTPGTAEAAAGARPNLSLSTNVATPATSGQSFAASPSGRLKMPVSAMKRTMSSQGGNASPTPLSENTSTNTIFNQLDPFQSPAPMADTAETPKTADQAAPVPAPMARGASKDYIAGYKAVPSLAQLKQRHQDKSPSVENGNGKENVAESKSDTVETRKTETAAKTEDVKPVKAEESKVKSESEVMKPEIVVKKVENEVKKNGDITPGFHALAHTWTMFFDSKTYKPPASDTSKGNSWEASLLTVGDIDSVENFARHFNNIRLPSRLNKGANYHLFKKGIQPMWEDPANAKGGKWVILVRNAPHLVDFAWANLVMGLIGDILDPDDQVCGIVASSRPKVDRIQLWTRSRSDEDAPSLNALGHRIMECMGFDANDQGSMSIEFQSHSSDAQPAQGLFFKQTFPPGRQAYPSNVPATPSRLGTSSHVAGPPDSPTSRLAPTMSGSRSPRIASSLGLPGQAESMRRIGSGQGMDAFAGPMGGKRHSFSSQGQTAKTGAGQ